MAVPLLMQHAYTQRLAHRRDDFQLGMYELGVPRPKSATYADCIVVFTYSGDIEVSKLSLDMARKGIRLVRIDSDRADETCLDGIDREGRLLVGNEVLAPRLIWKRHFLASRTVPEESRKTIDYAYAQMQAIEGVVHADGTTAINGRVRDPSLTGQLSMAERAGMRIPKSVISNDPQHAIAEIRPSSKMIVKSLGSTSFKSAMLRSAMMLLHSPFVALFAMHLVNDNSNLKN